MHTDMRARAKAHTHMFRVSFSFNTRIRTPPSYRKSRGKHGRRPNCRNSGAVRATTAYALPRVDKVSMAGGRIALGKAGQSSTRELPSTNHGCHGPRSAWRRAMLQGERFCHPCLLRLWENRRIASNTTYNQSTAARRHGVAVLRVHYQPTYGRHKSLQIQSRSCSLSACFGS